MFSKHFIFLPPPFLGIRSDEVNSATDVPLAKPSNFMPVERAGGNSAQSALMHLGVPSDHLATLSISVIMTGLMIVAGFPIKLALARILIFD